MHKDLFDEATKLKLNIFGECFEEWLPVFNYNKYTERIIIFDLFAGSGTDVEGNPGSPLVFLDKAKGKDRKYCSNVKKFTQFLFNEAIKSKSEELRKNIEHHLNTCKETNKCSSCKYSYMVENIDFKSFFSKPTVKSILNDSKAAKFVLLDQYGFSEIDEGIFRELISFPRTDFIFFIASSFISRFREHPNTTKYIDTTKINFKDIEPKEIHRAVAGYFRNLIPEDMEYYLHHFSIRKTPKKGNYYGLIFGSNHTLGMEKFLKVCWKHDPYSGEANYNIDNNWGEDSLFHKENKTIKKDNVQKDIKDAILSGRIVDNIEGLKYAMVKGCEPKLFTEVVKELEKTKEIERIGDKNYSSTNIHKAKKYFIKRLKNGT